MKKWEEERRQGDESRPIFDLSISRGPLPRGGSGVAYKGVKGVDLDTKWRRGRADKRDDLRLSYSSNSFLRTMSSIPFDQDQNTSDALSALSALASQASVHPGYQLQPSEDGGMGVVGGEEGGEGQLAPSGSSTTGVKFEGEHEWVMPDDHTLAAVFSGQDDTHRVHHGGEVSRSLNLGWDGNGTRSNARLTASLRE